MFRLIIFYIFLFSAFNTIRSQNSKQYIIKIAGIKIGNLYTNHVQSKNIDLYSVNSVVEFSFFKKIKIYYKTESLYIDGILVKSTVNSVVNQEQYTSITNRRNNRYYIDCHTYKYSYQDTTITEPITWSVSKLYFEKPITPQFVYAETYGKLGVLTEQKNGTLKLDIPKSKQIYQYSVHNKLCKVEMVNSLKNFEVEEVE